MTSRAFTSALTAIAAPWVFAGPASAADEIHVQQWRCTSDCSSGSCTPSLYSTTLYDSNEDIDIEVTECTRRINIWADSTAFSVGGVTITHTGTLPPFVELFIGQGDFPYAMGQSTAAAGDLSQIAINHEGLRQKTRFAGAIAGDSGIITVGKVYRYDVGGALVGGIDAEFSPEAEGLFNVYAASVGGVTLNAQSGTITRVEITGNMAGVISALDEGVEIVQVGGNLTGTVNAGDFINSVVVTGDIGTSTSAVQIKTFNSGGTIDVVQAANINANITAGNTGTGDLGKIATTSGTFFKGSVAALDLEGSSGVGLDIAGDALAAITLSGYVNAPIDIAGDLGANLTVGESVNAPIDIGGSLLSSATIKTYINLDPNASISMGDTDGLKGQVIINADGFDQGSWGGDVVVGTTTLSPTPSYDELPSNLGGGAVGHAGFNFHAWACVPPHGDEITGAPASVAVDHYGPVVNTTGSAPLKVEHRPAGSSGSWTDQTAQFTFTIESTYSYRHITIEPTSGNSFLEDKEYRITPQYVTGGSGATRLKCLFDHVTLANNTVGVVVYDYRFTILPGSFGPPL